MDEVSLKNKKAWEYRAYEFWNMNYRSPKEKAEEILKNPKARLRRYHQKYFNEVKGLNIANVCGSNGRIAVPLAVLGQMLQYLIFRKKIKDTHWSWLIVLAFQNIPIEKTRKFQVSSLL